MMFHSDTPYFERPAKATILYAIEITSWGGHTLFSNSYTAAEALPEDVKVKMTALMASMPAMDYDCYYSVAAGDSKGFQPITHEAYEVIIEARKLKSN